MILLIVFLGLLFLISLVLIISGAVKLSRVKPCRRQAVIFLVVGISLNLIISLMIFALAAFFLIEAAKGFDEVKYRQQAQKELQMARQTNDPKMVEKAIASINKSLSYVPQQCPLMQDTAVLKSAEDLQNQLKDSQSY